MAKVYALGKAPAVAQVSTVQVTGYDIATSYKLTVSGIVLTVIAAGSANATATALAAAWNTSTHPYFTGITASASTDTVTLTADRPGFPFVVSKSVSGGSGTLGSVTAVTASAGPFHYDTAANWSGGAVPANSDDVTIGPGIMFLFGIDANTITPASLTISKGAMIGLPLEAFTTNAIAPIASQAPITTTDATAYEYRTDFLRLATVKTTILDDGSNPSTLIKLDTVTANNAAVIYNTGVRQDGRAAVRLKGTHSSSTVEIFAGTVEHSNEVPGVTGQVATIGVFGPGAKAICGAGLTQATHNEVQSAGSTLHNVPTTVTVESTAGTLRLDGTGTITTLNKRGNIDTRGAALAITTLTG